MGKIMSNPISKLTKRQRSILIVSLLGTGCVVAGFFGRTWWLPQANRVLAWIGPKVSEGAEENGRQPAGDPAGGGATSLTLSEQAKKNVGLKLMTVELSTYEPPITIPGTIVDRPGRTELEVSAPMTGIVTRIYPIRGEAVEPGQPASPGQSAKPGGALFDLRLTHEDLVTTQREFLRALKEVDVIEKEIARIEGVISSGVVAGKRKWELEYEHNKIAAGCDALEKALFLHGLSRQQVEQIKTRRELVAEVTVYAPPLAEEPQDAGDPPWLQVSSVNVKPGQHVATGQRLCVLRDHARLYIEGMAFEEDALALNEAAKQGTPITAVVESGAQQPDELSGLRILYVEDEVELESRALRFYLELENERVRWESRADGRRFIAWRFKPGQRVELLLPFDRWENRIVLPVDAVIKEGLERFVFRQNGNHFERIPVHVEYTDHRYAVLGNTGDLFPGTEVVASGAYQMHLALKNTTGGGGGKEEHVGCSH